MNKNSLTLTDDVDATPLPNIVDKHLLPYLSTSILRALSIGLEYSIFTSWILRAAIVRLSSVKFAALSGLFSTEAWTSALAVATRVLRELSPRAIAAAACAALAVLFFVSLLFRAVTALRAYTCAEDRIRFLFLRPWFFGRNMKVYYVRDNQGMPVSNEETHSYAYCGYLLRKGALRAGYDFVPAVKDALVSNNINQPTFKNLPTSVCLLRNVYMHPLPDFPSVRVCIDYYGYTFYAQNEKDLDLFARTVMSNGLNTCTIHFCGASDTQYGNMPDFASAIEHCMLQTRPEQQHLTWTRNEAADQVRLSWFGIRSGSKGKNREEADANVEDDCCVTAGSYALEVDDAHRIVKLLRVFPMSISGPRGDNSLAEDVAEEFPGRRIVIYAKQLVVDKDSEKHRPNYGVASLVPSPPHATLYINLFCRSQSADLRAVAQQALIEFRAFREKRNSNALFVFQLLGFDNNHQPIFSKEILSPAHQHHHRASCLDRMPMREVWEPVSVSLQRYRDHDGQYFRDREMKRKVGVLLSGEPGTGKSELAVRMLKFAGVHALCINAGTITTPEQWCAVMRVNRILDVDVSDGKLGFILEELDVAPWARPRHDPTPSSSSSSSSGTAGASAAACPEDASGTSAIITALNSVAAAAAAVSAADPLLGPKSNDAKSSSSAIIDRVLTDLDSIAARECVFIATTNHPDRIDPALKRPGRLAERVTRRITRQECLDLYLELSVDRKPHPDPDSVPDMTHTVSSWVNLIHQTM